MSATDDFHAAVDAYNEAADRVHQWVPRAERMLRDIQRGTAGRADWDSMVASFNEDVAVAEGLQERLFSGELSRAAAEEFEPHVPVETAAGVQPSPRLARLERDRREQAWARTSRVPTFGPRRW